MAVLYIVRMDTQADQDLLPVSEVTDDRCCCWSSSGLLARRPLFTSWSDLVHAEGSDGMEIIQNKELFRTIEKWNTEFKIVSIKTIILSRE